MSSCSKRSVPTAAAYCAYLYTQFQADALHHAAVASGPGRECEACGYTPDLADSTRRFIPVPSIYHALRTSKTHLSDCYQGIIYFIGHPFLYPLARKRLLPAFLLTVFVIVNLFVWAYLPQVAFLAIFHNTGSAWVNGTFLTLGEASAITAILFEAFLVDESQVDVFDAVLVHKGYDDLVRQFRPVSDDSTIDPVRRLGKPTKSSVYGPFSFRQIAEFVILLPLNFVPFFGVPLFLLLTGYRAGPLQHWRYFKLLDFTKKERNAFVKRRRWQYLW